MRKLIILTFEPYVWKGRGAGFQMSLAGFSLAPQTHALYNTPNTHTPHRPLLLPPLRVQCFYNAKASGTTRKCRLSPGLIDNHLKQFNAQSFDMEQNTKQQTGICVPRRALG